MTVKAIFCVTLNQLSFRSKYLPSHLQDYSTCNNAKLEFPTYFYPYFDPNKWYMKNSLHGWDLNPWPIRLEAPALKPLDPEFPRQGHFLSTIFNIRK